MASLFKSLPTSTIGNILPSAVFKPPVPKPSGSFLPPVPKPPANTLAPLASTLASSATTLASSTTTLARPASKADSLNLITKNIDDATTTAIKKADDEAAAAAKKAGKQTNKEILTKKNALIGAVTIGGVAVSVIAADEYFEKNGKKYNIISIDNASSGSDIKTRITIQTGDDFTINDRVKLENTNCVPPIVGEFNIDKIISKDTFIIKTQDKVTTKGTRGTLTFYTTFESQFAQTLRNSVEGATSGIAGGITEGIINTTDSILESMGVSPEQRWIVYLGIGILLLLILLKYLNFI
jgi:hypothetical protein